LASNFQEFDFADRLHFLPFFDQLNRLTALSMREEENIFLAHYCHFRGLRKKNMAVERKKKEKKK
jgi:hypothetical protein